MAAVIAELSKKMRQREKKAQREMFYRSQALKGIFAALMGLLRQKSLQLPLVSPRGGIHVDSKGCKQAVSSTFGSNQRCLMTIKSQEATAKNQTQNIQRN